RPASNAASKTNGRTNRDLISNFIRVTSGVSGLVSEGRQFDDGAAAFGGFVGAKADAGPVGGLFRVRERRTVIVQRHGIFMREVWMAAAVSASLRKAKMRLLAGIVNAASRVFRNAFRQAFGEVGTLDRAGNLRLRPFRGVHDEWFVLDERPF